MICDTKFPRQFHQSVENLYVEYIQDAEHI